MGKEIFSFLLYLKQLISSPTRVAKSCSTLLDNILTNANEMVSQSGVLGIGLSDHQLVFWTRKKHKKFKLYKHKTIKTRSFKNIVQRNYVINSKMSNFPIIPIFMM